MPPVDRTVGEDDLAHAGRDLAPGQLILLRGRRRSAGAGTGEADDAAGSAAGDGAGTAGGAEGGAAATTTGFSTGFSAACSGGLLGRLLGRLHGRRGRRRGTRRRWRARARDLAASRSRGPWRLVRRPRAVGARGRRGGCARARRSCRSDTCRGRPGCRRRDSIRARCSRTRARSAAGCRRSGPAGDAAPAAAGARPVALKAKSPFSEEESQGVCSRRVSRSRRASRTRLNMISTGRSGTLMFCRMCLV